jgi:alpha-amylase
MVFDFQQKYVLHRAIVGGSYSLLLKNTNSFRGQGLERYAVTFIDNHDTFERDSYGSNQFGGQYCDLSNATTKSNILQAHAYLMAMPGVPCVFWPHWKSYQNEINAMIAVRKAAGIHSESVVL